MRRLPRFRLPIGVGPLALGDRKSTRLNSSHLVISYAVFCLKKKKTVSTELAALSNRRLEEIVLFHDNTTSILKAKNTLLYLLIKEPSGPPTHLILTGRSIIY